MNEEQEFYLERAIATGRKVVWMSNDGARVITKIGTRKDEHDMKCGYVDGGKPGDYIALWNVDSKEIVVGEFLSNLVENVFPLCPKCNNTKCHRVRREIDYHEEVWDWKCPKCKNWLTP